MKKNILVGVTSGIAIYKTVDLVSMLIKKDYQVKVVMTENAAKLINPLIFERMSRNKVYLDVFERDMDPEVKHIKLASWADCFIIAPLTANTMAKITYGICDNLVTNIALAYTKKMILVPSMNVNMLNNFITQQNISELEKRHIVMDSDFGRLACGDYGKGKFPKVERIFEEIENFFIKKDFKNKNILIANGPTLEEIDPVRYISNYSSGKMGNELALACKRRGANVTVVCGNVKSDYRNLGIEYVDVKTNEEMFSELKNRFDNTDILIMPAAPVDFKVKNRKVFKIKKTQDYNQIEIENNLDILKSLSNYKKSQFVVGFAAETNSLEDYARNKLESKKLDMVVANQISDENFAFNSDFNEVVIITKDKVIKTEKLSKYEIANKILDSVLEKI
ncbi:MAG: bifunctional phosphopantothenoylcysteine decarboxylase/phosphopantothenate--cysteine ligase CoaBC [Parvimonas sp.]|uniref:bifunctional phosphopantothenoylcysteine decarboxylase/phosphopantothenate--cysteine ligase CoaBC n=1 Tax=Parvimonas sp. TaxID=1944660 RepID=UPI0025FACAC5|nr:bifunctional phosphopantothenoylcysteine decarboxylase/phosphopantothenate--cysteine ligase CoaBC [Parvimonas sp.]MCI5997593.1 bifunctional phosphopantothenoylcysteine decarboxylase/phosphopantothenate--cysteine ligase CoaBC [Parvimonas sp.]MDY3051195.1 bifunctional phosphopantothenoylcysteine decarboxylase/phosphopantothenate--cysteine ligase CoaBC [Parvimonas sp.]